jgi:hypothetical protein
MVIFADRDAALYTESVIAKVRQQTNHKPEFKFSKSSHYLRDAFFQSVVTCPFTIRAILVRKEALQSGHLRSRTDSFYNFFVKMLMAHDNGVLDSARVRIDGSGSREFQRSLSTYLRRELGERVKEVKLSDSASDPLMQLADMCIGAITRAERDRDQATRWKEMIYPRIGDIWHFG